jgi:uncharacterized FlaG/YvyC family protein
MPEGKMSYEQINPIKSVELAAPAVQPVQVQVAAQVKTPPPKVEAKPKETQTQVESKPSVMGRNDVSLKFIVDNESNNITVLVLDKANNKIIRSIPADELNNFKEGDLLSLFA